MFNGLPATYQQQNYPMYQQPYQPTQPEWQGAGTFTYIQGGRTAAQAYPVAPGNTVLLLDTEQKGLYLKETDRTGKPLKMVSWRLEEETEAPQAPAQDIMTREDIERRIAEEVEERVREKIESITDTLREDIAASFMPETKARKGR